MNKILLILTIFFISGCGVDTNRVSILPQKEIKENKKLELPDFKEMKKKYELK